MRQLSAADLRERLIELSPEQAECIKSISEEDEDEVFIELHDGISKWEAVEVVVALAISGPDEIHCVEPNVIRLWWD